MKTLWETEGAGKGSGHLPPPLDVSAWIPQSRQRTLPLGLPELTEGEVTRHYTALARRNYGVDDGFYPLGSCTMKYNPRLHEWGANLPGFRDLHPHQPEETVQGILAVLYDLQQYLQAITGMAAFTLQPAAGAHGELTGILMIRAYHRYRGDLQRNEVIVPDSAHGTNPATSAMAGFRVVPVPSAPDGGVDVEALKAVLSPRTAALMLTNPSTLGLFETRIGEISTLVHEAGGLLYYDGANLNAILGKSRPGDMGFDVVHLNLHKTFATPHGGGGPGSGPVGVTSPLVPFLPLPRICQEESGYRLLREAPLSIGAVRSFVGNTGVLLRAYTYIRTLGAEGLAGVSEDAVLNANYLMERLRPVLSPAYDRRCMHEFVVSARTIKKETGIRALDMAKRLLDKGVHPPTIYFPLIVEEALMMEPTETESRESLDAFAQAIAEVVQEAKTEPETVRHAPHSMPVGRLDEVRAVKTPRLTWWQTP